MKKSNQGFTLVELVVTIAVASIVMLAATTTLNSYMRISKQGADINKQQNEVRVVLEVMERLASEKRITVEKDVDDYDWAVREISETGDPLQILFSYSAEEKTISTGAGAVLMEGVEGFSAEIDGSLLMLTVETKKGKYATSVYCRLGVEETTPTVYSSRRVVLESETTRSLPLAYAQERENFLSVLEAEVGSTGASRTTGEYFSEWYIGSYADNPGWNAQTPWCACFISWAMEQCSGDLMMVPRYADVEKFRSSFNLASWKTHAPDPGDIIFFDWVVNDTAYAQHVGVVTKVKDGKVHTIEGNADGEVARRTYMLDDPSILGYGVLNWT